MVVHIGTLTMFPSAPSQKLMQSLGINELEISSFPVRLHVGCPRSPTCLRHYLLDAQQPEGPEL